MRGLFRRFHSRRNLSEILRIPKVLFLVNSLRDLSLILGEPSPAVSRFILAPGKEGHSSETRFRRMGIRRDPGGHDKAVIRLP
jgi:hypothetical protein